MSSERAATRATVKQLLVDGYRNRAIADRLSLTMGEVQRMRKTLRRKHPEIPIQRKEKPAGVACPEVVIIAEGW